MPLTPESISSLLPLREPTFYILLSLAAGEKHGYAIIKDVEELSQGRQKLSTGTLYEALARLQEQNLIERVSRLQWIEDDPQEYQANPGRPRKVYRLTELGYRLLNAERERLQKLVQAAQQRLDHTPAG